MKKFNFKPATYREVVQLSRVIGNRGIKSSHVNDFLNVIKQYAENPENKDKNGNLVDYVFGPNFIYVNPITGHVIDGQHKWAAYIQAVEKGIISETTPILICYEEIDPSKEIQTIIDLNTKGLNWGLDDFVGSYVDLGYPSYIRLEHFSKEHSLCHVEAKNEVKIKYSYGLAIMQGKGHASLKAGTAEITEEDLVNGHTVHEELIKLRKGMYKLINSEEPNLEERSEKFARTPNPVIEAMAQVWWEKKDIVSVEQIIKACKSSKDLVAEFFRAKSNKKEWTAWFERVIGKCYAMGLFKAA